MSKYKNYLITRDAELQITEHREYWQNEVERVFTEAFLNLMDKVTPLPQGEAKEFWEANLLNLTPLLKRHQKVVYDFKKLEVEYNSLYRRYDELVDLFNKVKEEF